MSSSICQDPRGSNCFAFREIKGQFKGVCSGLCNCLSDTNFPNNKCAFYKQCSEVWSRKEDKRCLE